MAVVGWQASGCQSYDLLFAPAFLELQPASFLSENQQDIHTVTPIIGEPVKT